MRLGPLQSTFDSVIKPHFQGFNFAEPSDEPALFRPDSLAWEIYKNPITTFIGGISSVIMQLAEPRIRSGVWEHSGFKENVVGRTRRTGRAAMATIYGPASKAEKMIESVNAMHECVHGTTACGKPYSATDPELLRWVEETVTYSMISAYDTYVRELETSDKERDYDSRKHVTALYGVEHTSATEEEREAYFESMLPLLEANPNIHEFVEIVKTADLLPAPLRPLQRILVNAAVDNVPEAIREAIGLNDKPPMAAYERPIVKLACLFGDRAMSEAYPAAMASKRVGLPADHLFSGQQHFTNG